MCLDANAPFAEALRHEDLRTEAEAATYRTTIWQIRADQGAVVDYSTFERAEAAGFPADALVEDDHERCQAGGLTEESRNARAACTVSRAARKPDSCAVWTPCGDLMGCDR